MMEMTSKMQPGFELAKFSDLEYEGMTVELRYGGIPFAQLPRDNGKQNQETEMPSRFVPEGATFRLPANELIEALEEARNLVATLE